MLIRDMDISKWHAKQWKVTIGNHEITNNSQWDRGALGPFLDKNTLGFKNIQVVLLIKAQGRETMLRDRGNILAALLEPAELTLDGFCNHFMAILQRYSFEENVGNRQDLWHKLTLEMAGYEFGEQLVQTGTSGSITVLNPGNIVTPAVAEVLPAMGAAAVTVTGLGRNPDTGEEEPIIIRNLTTGHKVILDGETGLITQDGMPKTADVDFWEVPSLLPGNNTITCDNTQMSITIKIKPRFM